MGKDNCIFAYCWKQISYAVKIAQKLLRLSEKDKLTSSYFMYIEHMQN